MKLEYIGLRLAKGNIWAMFEDLDLNKSWNGSRYKFMCLTNNQYLSKKHALENRLWTPSYSDGKIIDWTGDEVEVLDIPFSSGNTGNIEATSYELIVFVFLHLAELIDDRTRNPR